MPNVFSNRVILASLEWLLSRWNVPGGLVLRLFRNDLEPTPASVVGDFLECNFAGYTSIAVGTLLSAPTLVQDGEYESTTAKFTYQPLAVGTGNNVYGLYVTLDGLLEASQRFPEPIVMQPGSAPIRIRVNPHVKSGSLFEIT